MNLDGTIEFDQEFDSIIGDIEVSRDAWGDFTFTGVKQ
ncbi:MAG: hypothetical protein ACI9O4_000738 [Chitinophagales bacterium]|jgi:hypothetical protein